jgi:hypothetical protein
MLVYERAMLCFAMMANLRMPRADPHPLDFDWRFDDRTVSELCRLVQGRNVLALGAPSVAKSMQASGGRVLLVDRQPIQEVRGQLVADALTPDVFERDFDVAIVDPPWYPRELVEWASAAGRAVRSGGEVLVSVWPAETRPGAADDLSRALAELSDWADVTELPIEVTYETPPFELIATSISENGVLARSPKHGRLVQLNARFRPLARRYSVQPALWHRFILNGYQLGVRLRPPTAVASLVYQHPHAKGWLWPFVSARAPEQDKIGLWSSAGEVAQVSNPNLLISLLQEAVGTRSATGFEALFNAAPELISWKIPRPPYQSVVEWQHP